MKNSLTFCSFAFALIALIYLQGQVVLAAPTESVVSVRGNAFSAFLSQALTSFNPSIDTAVFVVHGSDRNADVYYDSIDFAAKQLGRSASTLIISPHFKLATDTLLPSELTFTDEGWLRGDSALNANLTSFDVIDDLIASIIDPSVFPALKTIIITGHSAGGQLTQRFAVGSQSEDRFKNIHFRYLPANPGSYVYLNAKRPSFAVPNTFSIPDSPACAYNDYKYGLENLNPYMSRVDSKSMVNEYIDRDVTYLLGEADVLTDELDSDCPAILQGKTRIERGESFFAELKSEFPSNVHKMVTVPGVGHTERGMYLAAPVLNVLFIN